jgi:hypothetical protein
MTPTLPRRAFAFAMLVIGAAPLASAHASGNQLPAVQLAYADGFDAVCSQQTHYAIKPEWVAEVNAGLPEFTANWRRDGDRLLRATDELVGKQFRDKQFIVALSVCSFPSMSDPLLVNVRFSLKSFTADSLSPDVTTSIILHEILHHYVSDKTRHDSTLLSKYRDEDETVRSHLHLLALMNAAYARLGQTDTLARVIEKDKFNSAER